MNGFYRTIFKTAWRTTWRLKYLWFFGVFVALTSSGGEYDIITNNFAKITDLENGLQNLKVTMPQDFWSTIWHNLSAMFTTYISSSLLIFLVSLVILTIFIYLITVSQTALISASFRFRRGEKFTFIEGFILGTKFFWPIFVLNLWAKIFIYGFLVLFCLPLILVYITTGNFLWLGLASLLAFLIYIPFNIFVSFLLRYASAYIVLKGQRVKQAVKSSFSLFRKNWLVTFENAIILFLLSFVVLYIIIAVLSFANLPFTSAGYTIFTVITILVSAVIATFQFSAWTNIFVDLNEGRGIAKIIRLFRRKPGVESTEE